MALRTPIYLDINTLLSLAEYDEIEVPHQSEIVARTTRKRSGGGRVGLSGAGVNASAGTDVEYQETYSLAPREKSTVSKVIDALMKNDSVRVNPDGQTPLGKDDLIELEGTTRITAASLAGKMFYIMRRLMDTSDGDLDTILDLDVNDQPVVEQLKQVYLRNELLPIPILLELMDSTLPQRVYINVRPDHFIDTASANRVEADLRVLGTVSHLIMESKEGYLSAEQWLLHDWEYMMRRTLMLKVEDVVKDLVNDLDLTLPTHDVHAFLTGPAIVLDAVALY